MEPVGVHTDAVDVLHSGAVEGFCPGLILVVDGDDHVAESGHESLNGIEDQPVGKACALIEVEAMAHIDHFRAPAAVLVGRQSGDHTHNRLIGPDDVVVIFVQELAHVLIAQEIPGIHRAAFQPQDMNGIHHTLQIAADILHPAAHIGAGDFHPEAVFT